MTLRLQKYLARCGVSSRRGAEELIRQGRVTVNGSPVTEMGQKIDPETDKVKVDGKLVKGEESHVYYLLNKPVNVITSAMDDRGRKTVLDLLQGVDHRVYPVGRLDYDSEGLVLLTNDGPLAARLMHPRHDVPKTYRVLVRGCPSERILHRLSTGVMLEDGPTRPAGVKLLQTGEKGSEIEIILKEGRNRQIRRMCDAVGHPVIRLRREKMGPISLKGLSLGAFRELTASEVKALHKAAGIN